MSSSHQRQWLCLVPEPPKLRAKYLFVHFVLPKCSCFIPIAVQNTPTKNNLWEKGVYLACNSRRLTVHHWGKIKAGTEATSHVTSTVKSREKQMHPYLLFTVLLMLSKLLYTHAHPTVLHHLCREWFHPQWVFPNQSIKNQFLMDMYTGQPHLGNSSVKPLFLALVLANWHLKTSSTPALEHVD